MFKWNYITVAIVGTCVLIFGIGAGGIFLPKFFKKMVKSVSDPCWNVLFIFLIFYERYPLWFIATHTASRFRFARNVYENTILPRFPNLCIQLYKSR